MATGIAVGQANAILDALIRSVTYTDPAACYVKLHTGAPGSAGTANAATETTRKVVTCSAAALGSITNTVSCAWTNVAGTETYTHVSLWSTVGPAGGTFLASDELTDDQAVVAGDNYTLPIGGIVVTLGAVAS